MREIFPIFCTIMLLGWLLTGVAGATALGANKTDLAGQYTGAVFQDQQQADPASSHQVRLAMGKKAILDAHDAGIKFFRASVSGFYPVSIGDGHNDLTLWQKDPGQFWLAEDKMLDDLDAAGLQIVPVLIWNPTQFPSLGGDNITTFLRDSNSRSRELFQRFMKDFIGRYARRKTILFYELTNELNDDADLDLVKRNCGKQTGKCVWGNFSTADLLSFSRQVVPYIKTLDPERKVSSGYDIPRRSAQHLDAQPEYSPRGPDWTADSEDQFKQNLAAVHQGFDIISVHIYRGAENVRFGRPAGDEAKLVSDVMAVGRAIGKPVYIGEFGDKDGATPFLTNMFAAITHEKVDYASIWTWEYYQNSTYQTRNSSASASSVEPGYADSTIQLITQTERKLGSPVSTTAAPRVVLTWPLACALVTKPINVYAAASNGIQPVQNVQFFADGKPLSSSSTPPYKAVFDPAGFQGPVVTLQAKAVAPSGSSASYQTPVWIGAGPNSCNH